MLITIETLSLIEHFQIGKDWESYEECLQQYFKANKITDANKKVAVFLTVVGSYLYKLLCNLVSSSKPAEKSYDKLTTLLKQHLVPKTNSHSRKTDISQIYSEYLVSLKQLETCDYTFP